MIESERGTKEYLKGTFSECLKWYGTVKGAGVVSGGGVLEITLEIRNVEFTINPYSHCKKLRC